jgi:FAD synthase
VRSSGGDNVGFDISSVSDTADAAMKISLTLIRAAIKKKYVEVRLGIKYMTLQATNRKKGGALAVAEASISLGKS